MTSSEKIQLLRQRLPIPLLEAQRLLVFYEGDMELVAENWKKQQLEKLTQEAKISKEQAQAFLIQHDYDYQKALKETYSQKNNLLARTIALTKDLWSVLYRVAEVIRRQNRIEEYVFYSTTALVGVPEAEAKFYLIWQWVNYIQLESKEVINRTPQEVIEVLKELSLNRHVHMIEAIQKGEATVEEIAGEFMVESEIGEALLQLIKAHAENKPQ